MYAFMLEYSPLLRHNFIQLDVNHHKNLDKLDVEPDTWPFWNFPAPEQTGEKRFLAQW